MASELGWSWRSFSYSEPISIHSMLNDWDGNLEQGEFALSKSRTMLNWKTDTGFQLGVIYFYDYFTRFNQALAELKYRHERERSLSGKRYDVYLEAFHVSGRGLRLGYEFEFRQWSILFAGHWFRTYSLTDGRLSGAVEYLEEDRVSSEIQVDYAYKEDNLFDRPLEWSPKGDGYSMDFRIEGQLHRQWRLQVEGIDLLRRVHWQAAPFTRATLKTEDQPLDEDGKVNGRPLFSGVESDKALWQKGGEDYGVQLTYLLDQPWWGIARYQFGARFLDGEEFPYVQAHWPLQTGSWHLGVGLEYPSLIAGYRQQYFFVEVELDHWAYQDTHTLMLNFGWTVDLIL